MKTIVVTGAAGFIGSNLCDYVLSNERTVRIIGIDNFITGSRDNIQYLLKHYPTRFDFVFGNAQDKILSIDEPIDFIYHLACPASPIFYQQYAVATLLSGSNAAINVLEVAKEKKATVLLASTSEVYGSAKQFPQSEEYWGHVNSYGPRSMYDEAKRFQEAAAWVYTNKFKVDVRIARIFNTYGPYMRNDDGRVIPQFITQALQGSPITLHGNGNQTRSFCYITDLLRGLIALMQSQYKKPMNLGNPSEVSMYELAQEIKMYCNSKSEIVFTDRPVDDPERRCPDITLAKNELDWQPKVNRAEGLKLTIEYFKQLQPVTS